MKFAEQLDNIQGHCMSNFQSLLVEMDVEN